jgi:hypothetical protein
MMQVQVKQTEQNDLDQGIADQILNDGKRLDRREATLQQPEQNGQQEKKSRAANAVNNRHNARKRQANTLQIQILRTVFLDNHICHKHYPLCCATEFPPLKPVSAGACKPTFKINCLKAREKGKYRELPAITST